MHKKKIILLCLAGMLLIAVAGTVYAAVTGPSIDWWVFSGGGAPASGGEFELNASIGQPIAGTSESGSFSIDHGYWVRGNYLIYLPIVFR